MKRTAPKNGTTASSKRVAPKNSKVIGEARDRLVAQVKAAYQAGDSIRQIAAETGRSYGAIHHMLAETGIEFRPRGGQHGRLRRQP